MTTYALLGYPLSHSFSRGYFTKKFAELGLSDTHQYVNFELEDVNQLKEKLEEYEDVRGCNVTIPHKRSVVELMDDIDPAAERIGAVNTILIREGRMIGYNTDYWGFRNDLLEQMKLQGHDTDLSGQSALILGTGGASLAVREALKSLGVSGQYVSRSPGVNQLTYSELDRNTMESHRIIVNTTPLGMSPRVETAPDIPFEFISDRHFCYDLVYNPAETKFLRLARGGGAGAANGLGMLHKQAEASWEIWTRE
ncbi:shikimate dehydrogenase [Lewinella aquimaris]|uniref:Shikimate dehydrogenase n=1 Tax=Neolewinella aquimaris TaxID=1835722 RepID=A0A840E7A1_9BACT|nr:shikimate dehydrogenase [Neolewinella aquimaris]MBB4077679.1 shikimate dehydrogenase [Neolewinella aquimaris]